MPVSDSTNLQREDPTDFLQTADSLGYSTDAPTKLPDTAEFPLESSEVNSSVPVQLEKTGGDENTVQLQMPPVTAMTALQFPSDCLTL